jgi:ATP-dependent RNA helicase DDX51/DBP6
MTPIPSTTVKVSRVTDHPVFELFIPLIKTKARKRYLKAKRVRKKHRRAAEARLASAAGTAPPDDAEGDIDYNDQGGDRHASDPDEESEVVVDVDRNGAQAEHAKNTSQLERQPQTKKHRKKGKSDAVTGTPAEDGDVMRPPRKRQKLDRGDTSPGPLRYAAAAAAVVDPSSPVSSSPNLPDESPSLERRTPTPTPTSPPPSLPRFPLPSRPHVPEKSELVAQALDRALARAQLVDPALSTPLSLDEDDGDITGLSARMIRRLGDLGITELFAGAYHLASPFARNPGVKLYDVVQTTLLPLLLPSERQKRSLYLPYDPPSDICVSAPTGSGKTLAYVLPIVEVRVSCHDL